MRRSINGTRILRLPGAAKRPDGKLIVIAGLILATPAFGFQAGLTQLSVARATPESPSITVALYYPTQSTAQPVPMGPFTPKIALQAPPAKPIKGLIVLSHGTGGSELGHTSLAEALAQDGYVVAALRHPGDNWQDLSLFNDGPRHYFEERPRQVSRVIDAILDDPLWGDRIPRDAEGPLIGAVGHSAGGYTVLALAGGEPDMSRLIRHCDVEREDDPIFCRRADTTANPAALEGSAPSPLPLTDRRVRAVVAMAPVGVVFTAASLARVRLPTTIYEASLDPVLVPRFHSDWVSANLSGAHFRRVPNAGHFAFVDTPSMPIPTEFGDLGANPPGFDRAAFLRQLAVEVPAFFDTAFRQQYLPPDR